MERDPGRKRTVMLLSAFIANRVLTSAGVTARGCDRVSEQLAMPYAKGGKNVS